MIDPDHLNLMLRKRNIFITGIDYQERNQVFGDFIKSEFRYLLKTESKIILYPASEDHKVYLIKSDKEIVQLPLGYNVSSHDAILIPVDQGVLTNSYLLTIVCDNNGWLIEKELIKHMRVIVLDIFPFNKKNIENLISGFEYVSVWMLKNSIIKHSSTDIDTEDTILKQQYDNYKSKFQETNIADSFSREVLIKSLHPAISHKRKTRIDFINKLKHKRKSFENTFDIYFQSILNERLLKPEVMDSIFLYDNNWKKKSINIGEKWWEIIENEINPFNKILYSIIIDNYLSFARDEVKERLDEILINSVNELKKKLSIQVSIEITSEFDYFQKVIDFKKQYMKTILRFCEHELPEKIKEFINSYFNQYEYQEIV